MHSVHRQLGKLTVRGPGDNAKVSVLLKEYEDADQILAKIIESIKSWRESWILLLNSQLETVSQYSSLYDPIVGATDGHSRDAAPTPELQLNRSFGIKEAYTDLKTELLMEIPSIDERILVPATRARECIAPMRKTIKKRENKRVDYEQCQDKVHKMHRKGSKAAKDVAALVKAEEDLQNLNTEFDIADSHLRQTLPPIIEATFSLVPLLVSAHVLIQNRLLGLYYTTIHDYCEQHGFPSPAPPMDQVIASWSADFKPIQQEVERLPIIARGGAIRRPMRLPDDEETRKVSGRLEPRRSSSGFASSNGSTALTPRTSRIPSTTTVATSTGESSPQQSPMSSPQPDASRTPSFGAHLRPTDFTTASDLGRSSGGMATPPSTVRSANDYFSGRTLSRGSIATTPGSENGLMVKKKPPPPPPPKRIPSSKPEEFVVALYAYNGEGATDLSFREGDRIKIVKKTATDQDWWQGEINGVKGSFPANYCRAE